MNNPLEPILELFGYEETSREEVRLIEIKDE